MPLSLRLNESDFQGVDFNLPPIRDPKGLEKFDPVNGYAMREVLEPVPQVPSQNLNMTLNGVPRPRRGIVSPVFFCGAS
ncbi:hypothetical protein BELL_0341g00010 [Botrytis elliptica]|uniref:Uncharacterized protein n=1 Tax=Botrytis elliptica TaxID=278938 RepID=A0A4Z1JQ02_9HELO|nr:hypothetical protein BELL_0341g00010 [Botrytis elliptica]